MKKILVFLCAMFVGVVALAQTINVNWKVGDTTYASNTCEYGGTLTVPSTPPTKYGYTFQGWASYTFLEYIESTGTQYIDTGTTINEDSKVDILYSMTSIGASQMPFGTRISGSGSDAMNGIFRTHGLDSNRVAFGVGGGTNKDIQGYNASNTDYNLVIDKNAAVINEATVATFSTSSITNTFPMYIFACNTSGTESFVASMKLYSFKLYNNNVLVRNMVPAKNPNGVVGMFDTVTQTFFTNAGTGDFIAGPELYNL